MPASCFLLACNETWLVGEDAAKEIAAIATPEADAAKDGDGAVTFITLFVSIPWLVGEDAAKEIADKAIPEVDAAKDDDGAAVITSSCSIP